MSSNQSRTGKRKVTSIVRRLVRRGFRKQISSCLIADFFVCVLVIFLCLAVTELSANGGKPFSNAKRKVKFYRPEVNEELISTDAKKKAEYFADIERINETAVYTVRLKGSDEEYSFKVGAYFVYPITFFGAFFLLQFVGALFGTISERRKVERILNPLEEIADKADELSRIEFDEEKYVILEEKINNLATEDTLQVSQGDKELERIESAINRLLTRMRESNMRQARFVNDASHELRTPIAVIEGYSNMLARWGREDEKVLDESINAIRNESAHMKYLVEQLLFLARGDSGKTVLHPEHLNLCDMMREIYEESLMIDERHIYRFQESEAPVYADCDPALMKQAVRILVDNAAKYTNEGDEILLSQGVQNGVPYLQVQDTGIGMEENAVSHMFERFYRADEARSYKGTGLGLSIAKWIIDKHKGHFEVTSRPGLGTRIRIVLG
jgi:signal transduction histidine kinase